MTPTGPTPRGELPFSIAIETKGGTVLFKATSSGTEEHARFIVYAVNHIEQAEADRDEALALLREVDPVDSDWWKRVMQFLAAHPAPQGEVEG